MTRVITKISQMQELCRKAHSRGLTIGLVPTMGYLHEGHLALVRAARKQCNLVAVSIFVNPLQFGPQEDLGKYPRDLKRDLKMLIKEKVDFVFHPAYQEMYPMGPITFVEVKELGQKLCGQFRPIHFRGVTTVVAKLFNAIPADQAFFGLKDFQQFVIIKKMAQELNFPIEIVGRPTVREKDGLAMSSRNKYLSPQERREAAILYQSLRLAKKSVRQGERRSAQIKAQMKKLIAAHPAIKLQYLSICNPRTLNDVPRIKEQTLIALAAYLGKTRLIDNILL